VTSCVRSCLQALAELFCRVAGHRASAHHQVLVGHQDLGALVAGALGALKLQVRCCNLCEGSKHLPCALLFCHPSSLVS
jgi:hypothetical protein